MILNKKAIKEVRLSFPKEDLKRYPYLLHQDEHYRLLKYISFQYSNALFLDVGTLFGHSALCLSANPENRVITYDIKKQSKILDNIKNVQIKIMDGNIEDAEILKQAKVILLDVDPHDSLQEMRFYNTLKFYDFKGILILDDIHLNKNMNTFWDALALEKHDLTEIAHHSGTGLVNFGKEKIYII